MLNLEHWISVLPSSSGATTIVTSPTRWASSALIGIPVRTMKAAVVRFITLDIPIPGVEQKSPKLALIQRTKLELEGVLPEKIYTDYPGVENLEDGKAIAKSQEDTS